MRRVVADVGNTRLKWGRLDEAGRLEDAATLDLDATVGWDAAWSRWGLDAGEGSDWAVASVNPPVADRLAAYLSGRGVLAPRWYRSAADVPVRHALVRPETAGADRALGVAEAVASRGGVGPALVVSCGTAITVDRIAADGTWQGGAIAPGLRLSARALHLLTAQLPEVDVAEAPLGWGSSTLPAIAAGVFWGVVGSIRELLDRQAEGLSPSPPVVWTGGDAALLAPRVAGDFAEIVPELVLRGLARVAFGRGGG